MTGKMQYTAVGAFVLVLGAAFVWGVLWISAGGAPQRFDRYLIYMTESVSGLNVDSALKYRGLDVGKVEQMTIDSEYPERIRIVLQVREDIPVTEDTRATIEYQGLTGLANINLSGGTAASAPLGKQAGEEYPVIQTSPSLLARLDSTTTDLLANLIQTSTRINALLDDDNRSNLALTLQNIATLSENLAAQSGQLDEVVSRLRETLDNTRAASAALPQLMAEFTQGATSVARLADQYHSIGESVASVGEVLRDTVRSTGDDLDHFSAAILPEFAQMAEDLRRTSENLRRMSESLARDPSVLLYGADPPAPGPGEKPE